MCSPALAVGISQGLMGAVQSIGGYSAEKAAARESERAYQEQRQLNAEAANRGYQQAQSKLMGEYAQASQKAEQLLVNRLQAQGTTLASGRVGQSVGGLLTDAQRIEGKDLATLGMNLGYARQDYTLDAANIFSQHKTANIQAAAQRKGKPSAGGLIMGLAGAAVSGYGAYASLKAPSGGGGKGKGIANPDINTYTK